MDGPSGPPSMMVLIFFFFRFLHTANMHKILPSSGRARFFWSLEEEEDDEEEEEEEEEEEAEAEDGSILGDGNE